MLRVRTPLPALYGGLPLYPDSDADPYVFRLDLSKFGMATVRLVFGHEARVGTKAIHTDLGSQPVSLYKRPTASLTRLWATSALGALTAAAVVTAVRRLRRRPHKEMVR